MTPNPSRFRASSHKDLSNTNSSDFTLGLLISLIGHHLQIAKLHLFTHVTSNKIGDSQPVGLGHQALKTFAICPSDHAQVSR